MNNGAVAEWRNILGRRFFMHACQQTLKLFAKYNMKPKFML